MGQDVLTIISAFMSNTFDLLTSVKFPGTDYSIFGLLVISAGFGVVCMILRFLVGLSAVGAGKTFGSGGNNSKIKVSKERSKDTK